MTDTLQLDFAGDDTEAGFRLQRIEVFNWGTFDKRISTLTLDGLNTLVTGENGSGKSTFIDALTTLLVPANRIAYNRAAGADRKERDLRSYVLGYFRSEYNDLTGASKPVAMRPKGTVSVILGVFRNTGFDQVVTVAQVYWPAEQGQPNRFFVLAERDLGIAEHFLNFANIRGLKAKLRDVSAEIFDQFEPYGARMRRLLGVQSEQALELFHQTVSMKAVGNLTEFVRAHMLDIAPVKDRLDHLITHFDDLTRAYAAVIRAKRQVDLLRPIADEVERRREELQQRRVLDQCRQELRPHVGRRKIELLTGDLARLAVEQSKAEQQREGARESRRAAQHRVAAIESDIASSGGDELRRLDASINELSGERDRRRITATSFEADAQIAGLSVPLDLAEFVDMKAAVLQRRTSLDGERVSQDERSGELQATLLDLRTRHKQLNDEIDNLRAQRGNIPLSQVQLRSLICADLGVETSELPFTGELVRVREGEERWEGAAERLLHNFALSMLVPEDHYPAVQRWVENRHLGQRLVYFRIPPRVRARDEDIHRLAMLHKLDVHEGIPAAIAQWVRGELTARANVVCCETAEQFQREQRAITVNGQIKGNQRHEKDDRFRIDDRSRYVLGWSSDSKIAVLDRQRVEVETQIRDAGSDWARIRQQRSTSNSVAEALARLETRSFRDIDWHAVASMISEQQQSRQALLAASDRLNELQAQRTDALRAYDTAEVAVSEADRRVGSLEDKIVETQDEREELAAEFDQTDNKDHTNQAHNTLESDEAVEVAQRIRLLLTDLLPESPRRVRQLVDAESAARDRLTGEIDAADHRIKRLDVKLIGRMKDFTAEFPTEAQELDVSLDALAGYEELLDRLRADDLPRFEATFRDLLNENTLREIAGFQQVLHQERTDIHERIDKINSSLATIEYNRGRYIALVAEPTRDLEIREFQAELRSCTEGTLTTSDDPTLVERKFLQVRALIDRFRGRSNSADADRRWTQKVTDVRNWFTFAASERLTDDDSEYEHYSDSAGKSGGQKEKLAYTVLAASLAYQFGLELGETKSRSFRFVAIDEAFGRADTEATQFGLGLFAKLHLQLLVVTPLQRIAIIEPFVQRVGFVSVHDDRSSIANLTIEDYRKRRSRS
jgi:uncharacterized protein YPO0396